MGVATRPRGAMVLAAAAVLCVAPRGASGQERQGPDTVRIVGEVVDQITDSSIAGARVSVVLKGEPGQAVRVIWAGVTDSVGTFESTPIRAGNYSLTVEALGYKIADESVDLSGSLELEIRVELVPEPFELEPLVVVSRIQSRLEASGFYDRRRMGQGYSLTREEIEAHRLLRASDVFRFIPGVTLVPSRRGALVRFRSCSPDVVLDGTPLVSPVPIDEILGIEDLEAIEVFSGASAPVNLRTSTCGVVVLWTREGRRDEKGHPLTWKRLLAVGGFILFAILMTR